MIKGKKKKKPTPKVGKRWIPGDRFLSRDGDTTCLTWGIVLENRKKSLAICNMPFRPGERYLVLGDFPIPNNAQMISPNEMPSDVALALRAVARALNLH